MNAHTPDVTRHPTTERATDPAAGATPEGNNPARVGSRSELVIGLAAISAVLSGIGLLTSAAMSLAALAIFLIVSGIICGLVGVGLGLARGRTGPATAAGGAAVFGVLVLVFVLMWALGGEDDGSPEPREPGQPLVSPVRTE